MSLAQRPVSLATLAKENKEARQSRTRIGCFLSPTSNSVLTYVPKKDRQPKRLPISRLPAYEKITAEPTVASRAHKGGSHCAPR